MADFKLSASLKGHEDDVRAVVFPSPNYVISASRDATVRLWRRTAGKTPPEYDDSVASNASGFVNSVAFVPSSPEHPDGLIVSGGKDTLIDVRELGKAPESDPDRLLIGHQGNVCSLDVSPDAKIPFLVSGSWDASAKIWDIVKGENVATLPGHEASVWAVLAYDAEHIITACADTKIRIFTPSGKLIKTIPGSQDVVRALCKLPAGNSYNAHFASAGNDGIISLWTLEGDRLATLFGHENFVYSLAALPTGELISSSEDRTVRVWRNGECIQTITHPAISVWCVAVCAETGDIVTGASDRIVRVFSRSKDQYAAPETIQAFEDSIKQSAIPQQAMPEVNKQNLPRPDFLQNKSGTKDGQVQMIHEANGSIGAYTWSSGQNQWVSVGTVVDSAGGSSAKQQHMGQDYDYVFDVDIQEGAPPLKLPYNLSQNAHEVAQKFIADNELPASYVDEVAKFILKNTEGATLSQTIAGGDQQPPAATTRQAIIPQKDYLKLTNASFPPMLKKIEDLNAALISSGRKDICFSPQDLAAIKSLTQKLEAAMKDPTTSPTITSGLALCMRIVTEWPPENRLPGLDLLRCLAAATPAIASSDFDVLKVLNDSDALVSSQNTAMLAVRLLANLFAHEEGRKLALTRISDIHAAVRPHMQPNSGANRNLHIAAATLYINYAVLFSKDTEVSSKARPGLLDDLVVLLADPAVVDSETQYRALVAVGTLLTLEGDRKGSLEEIQGGRAGLLAAIQRVGATAKEPRIKACIAEVEGLC